MKDEYDFDGPQSLPSIEGGHCIQTIQHPPASHPNASEPFVPSNLLPPTEASTSASTSSFAMAAGSGSKIVNRDDNIHNLSPVSEPPKDSDAILSLLLILILFVPLVT